MPTLENASNWAYHLLNIYVPALEFCRRVVMEKFLPSISDEVIRQEVEQIEKQAFERLGKSVSPEDYDPGDFVDAARDEAIEFYQFMRDTRQGVVNGLAAVLYHLFEQQLCAFYRLVARDKKAVIYKGLEAVQKLQALGLDVTKFTEWRAVDELRLLANCVKHAEGSACKQLAELRPDLFERPSMGPRPRVPRRFVERPLSGEGVYFCTEEFDKKAECLKRFWKCVAEEISG